MIIKRFIIITHLLIALLFMNSCRNDVLPKKISEISINIKQPYAFVPNSVNCCRNSAMLTLQSLTDFNLHYFEIQSSEVISSLTVNSQILEYSPFFQLYIKSIDSIFIFNPQSNQIRIVDTSGSVLFDKLLAIGLPTSNPENLLNYFGGKLFLGNSDKYYNVSVTNDRLKYYNNVRPIYQLDFKSNHEPVESIWGSFPSSYINKNLDYCNFFPIICSYSLTDELVSFFSDDSIYLYKNGIKKQSLLCKSKYINSFIPLPDEKSLDMAYFKSYQLNEPKYMNLIYNKYKKQYYRIAKHRFSYKSENTLDIENMTWSIIILDNELNLVKEVIFDYRLNSPDIIVCASDGTYISNVPSTPKDANTLSLTLYDF